MTNPVVYAIPDLVKARLETVLQTVEAYASVPVLRAANMTALPRNVPLAVVVVPAGLEVDEQRRGQVCLSEAVAVVAQVRNPTDQLTGEAALNDAGPLLATCVGALLGWTPDDAYEPLQMMAAPGPEYGAGFGYYPIAFHTRYVLGASS